MESFASKRCVACSVKSVHNLFRLGAIDLDENEAKHAFKDTYRVFCKSSLRELAKYAHSAYQACYYMHDYSDILIDYISIPGLEDVSLRSLCDSEQYAYTYSHELFTMRSCNGFSP